MTLVDDDQATQLRQTRTKSVVIIGGGFAGTVLAQQLEKKLPLDWEIYLLSQSNYLTFNPLLPEVIGASLLPGHVLAPIRQMVKRTRIRMVCVDNIDFADKIIYYHNDEAGQLHYDHIVFAAGVRANTSIIPGMDEYALPLKTVGDALFIRNQVIEKLEHATIHPDPERRKSLTNFIIVGGGFSGVEVAGELDDFLASAQRYYKNVRREDCKLILLHSGDRLLPELSASLGIKTGKIFSKRGIEVRLNTRVVRVDNETVILDSGEELPGSIIICTIGTTSNEFILASDLPQERGKITVDADMSVPGMDGVWALGDCARVPNGSQNQDKQPLSPPTAQFADRQGKFLARNIALNIAGKQTRAFHYKPIGMLASIGHNKAVAEIYGIPLSGFVAWLIWRAIYLAKMPTLPRKIRLFLEWSWAMFFPPDIAHLGFERTDKTK